eukprot:5491800-Pyramimonas_sp.AAC.1
MEAAEAEAEKRLAAMKAELEEAMLSQRNLRDAHSAARTVAEEAEAKQKQAEQALEAATAVSHGVVVVRNRIGHNGLRSDQSIP